MSEQVEASCDALIAKLRAGLNTKLAAISAAQTDLALEPVPDEQIDLGTRPELPYPFVMVLPEDSKPELDPGQYVTWEHRILVVTWVADPIPQDLSRRLLRYERAVREVVLEGRSLSGNGGYGVVHLGDRRGRMFRPEPHGEYTQYSSSLFQVRQDQTLV